MNNDRRNRQLAEHRGRIAFEFRRIGQQDDLHRLPFLMQPSRRHEAVAAVVPFAAENDHAPHRTVMRQHMLRDSRSRVLHQRERWDTESFARRAIDLSHFCCSNNFHLRSFFQSPKDYKTKRPPALCGGRSNNRESLSFRRTSRCQSLHSTVLHAVGEVHDQTNGEPDD